MTYYRAAEMYSVRKRGVKARCVVLSMTRNEFGGITGADVVYEDGRLGFVRYSDLRIIEPIETFSAEVEGY